MHSHVPHVPQTLYHQPDKLLPIDKRVVIERPPRQSHLRHKRLVLLRRMRVPIQLLR